MNIEVFKIFKNILNTQNFVLRRKTWIFAPFNGKALRFFLSMPIFFWALIAELSQWNPNFYTSIFTLHTTTWQKGSDQNNFGSDCHFLAVDFRDKDTGQMSHWKDGIKRRGPNQINPLFCVNTPSEAWLQEKYSAEKTADKGGKKHSFIDQKRAPLKHQSLLLTASPAQGHRSCVQSEPSHGWRRSFTVDELPVHHRSSTGREATTDRGGDPTHMT